VPGICTAPGTPCQCSRQSGRPGPSRPASCPRAWTAMRRIPHETNVAHQSWVCAGCPGFSGPRRVLAALAVLGAGRPPAWPRPPPPPASAATSCQVAYSANSWSTGFTASITITNEGSALTSWTLAYTYSGNHAARPRAGRENWSQSGETVTVTNASWNGSLATGASTSIGANFSYSGTNTAPAAFTINGTACNGASGSPSPSPSTTPTSLTDPDRDAHPDPASPSPTSTGGGSCGSGVKPARQTRARSPWPRAPARCSASRCPPPRRPASRSAWRRRGQQRPVRVGAGSSVTLTSSNWNPAAAGHGGGELIRHRRGHVHGQRARLHVGHRDRNRDPRPAPRPHRPHVCQPVHHGSHLVLQPQLHLGSGHVWPPGVQSAPWHAQIAAGRPASSTGGSLGREGETTSCAILRRTANSNRMSLQHAAGHGGSRRIGQHADHRPAGDLRPAEPGLRGPRLQTGS